MNEIVLYRCQNCGGSQKIRGLPQVREVVIGCGGQLEVIHILRAFEDGATGVCVVYCDPGECKTLEGSPSAVRRIKYARQLLEEIPFDTEKLKSICYQEGCDLDKELSGFINALNSH